MRGAVQVGNHKSSFSAEAVDQDFVRLGAKYNDLNEELRRDDAIDIAIGIDRTLGLFVSVITSVVDQLAVPFGDAVHLDKYTLAPKDAQLAKVALHPFGFQKGVILGGPVVPWALQALAGIEYPTRIVRPADVPLDESPLLHDTLPGTISAQSDRWSQFVCQIETSVGVGSGALISGDGLVLTCAHVLVGTNGRVIFRNGERKGEYSFDRVFVNQKTDTAIVRARNLKAKSWLPVRLNGKAKKGERIVAMGNPALGEDSQAIDAITEGLVSSIATNQSDEILVLTVPVASGSSGGPIISQETGEIIGVVQAVFSPTVNESNLARSGFFCKAAPSSKFGEWLGLRSKQ